jgi:hypothetical protein
MTSSTGKPRPKRAYGANCTNNAAKLKPLKSPQPNWFNAWGPVTRAPVVGEEVLPTLLEKVRDLAAGCF